MTVRVHHTARREVAPGVYEFAKPLRDSSSWHQRKQERLCRLEAGHCWHPEALIDWWCCMCAGQTEGMPSQNCVYCAAG